ncbi:MAG: hypothetical protein LBR94_10110 [Desulfovibrio sp.]|jgi:hypothetical protein|nr:hypothetical protein [Desulfovibrio sp.]
MAESKVTMNNGDGKGKVLCNVKEVRTLSLPRSLRHGYKECLLLDAKGLVYFLQDFAAMVPDADLVIRDEAWYGMQVVLDLLLDKIEIGMGWYNFPMSAPDDGDAPALAERE